MVIGGGAVGKPTNIFGLAFDTELSSERTKSVNSILKTLPPMRLFGVLGRTKINIGMTANRF